MGGSILIIDRKLNGIHMVAVNREGPLLSDGTGSPSSSLGATRYRVWYFTGPHGIRGCNILPIPVEVEIQPAHTLIAHVGTSLRHNHV